MNSSVWFQHPTGTRDFYPPDLNRRRYLQEAWRRVAVLHGFDEVDGPAFERLDLYTSHSGKTLSAHAFTFAQRGGEMTFALRPEFTPSMARMFADRSGELPSPTRWFSTSNCFRSERPNSGRLREFWQWNADIIGDGSARADAEAIACCVAALERLGLKPTDVRIKVSHRGVVASLLRSAGVPAERIGEALDILDVRGKVSESQLAKQASDLGFDLHAFDQLAIVAADGFAKQKFKDLLAGAGSEVLGAFGAVSSADFYQLSDIASELRSAAVLEWCDLELGVVRGIAYYTGMVFEAREVVAEGAMPRTIAGGGRYDSLIAAFGGTSTPAVGFGMTDQPLMAVLESHGLMPSEQALTSMLGARPDVLVYCETEDGGATTGLLANLRNEGIHARRARGLTEAELTAEAVSIGARFTAVILGGGGGGQVVLVDLSTGKRQQTSMDAVGANIVSEKQRPAGIARVVAASTN